MALTPTDPELIKGILPRREVSILAGASGAGKTTLLLQIVKALQANEPVFGHEIQENLRIGYLAADRAWAAYVITATKAGVDLERMASKALIDDTNISLERMKSAPMGLLHDIIRTFLPCDLVIIDPLVIFFGTDPRLYHTSAAHLIQLNRWCIEHSITILGTHHATKARTDFTFKRPQDRISGSSALLGFSSTQLFLMEPEKGGPATYQFHIISHTAPAEVINFTKDPNGLFLPFTGELEDFQARRVLDLCPEAGQTVPRAFFVDSLPDLGAGVVDKALRDLLAAGLVTRTSHGRYRRSTN